MDLIDRAALLKELATHFNKVDGSTLYHPSMALAMHDVRNAPAVDAVEVCRCKDCKHWREETLWCDMNSIDRGEHYTWYAEDFCSYGERKEN